VDVAVIDMAGTTVREDGLVEASFRAAIERVGAPFPHDFHARFTAVRGAAKIDMFTALLDGDAALAAGAEGVFGDVLADAIRAGGVSAMPGAVDAITRLRAAGVAVALVTGFAGPIRDVLVETLGWSSLADLVLSSSDVRRGRPAPDLVLTAALELGAGSMARVAAAGDTVNDLVAGTRAGAGIVAGVLTGAHGIAELGTAPHTHIVPTVAEFAAVVTTSSSSSDRPGPRG
jgi:phosphonatase-like hydrolase